MTSIGRWRSAAQTHPGRRRRTNEDSVVSLPELGLWAVADGMGGHDAGDYASRAIAEALGTLRHPGSLTELVDRVDDVLGSINGKLREHAELCCEGRTVGSTVVALVSDGDVGVALWAGDSRLYRVRGGELLQVTRDHNPMADLLDDGLIGEHTARRRESNIVTRAVGGQGQLFLDVAVFDVRPADTFLLCSDGLYRELSDREIGAALSADDPELCAPSLIEASLARGARDNVSVIVARRGA